MRLFINEVNSLIDIFNELFKPLLRYENFVSFEKAEYI